MASSASAPSSICEIGRGVACTPRHELTLCAPNRNSSSARLSASAMGGASSMASSRLPGTPWSRYSAAAAWAASSRPSMPVSASSASRAARRQSNSMRSCVTTSTVTVWPSTTCSSSLTTSISWRSATSISATRATRPTCMAIHSPAKASPTRQPIPHRMRASFGWTTDSASTTPSTSPPSAYSGVSKVGRMPSNPIPLIASPTIAANRKIRMLGSHSITACSAEPSSPW